MLVYEWNIPRKERKIRRVIVFNFNNRSLLSSIHFCNS
jgi:hypothetical protein